MARIRVAPKIDNRVAPKIVKVVKSIFDAFTLQDLRKMVSEYKTKHDVVNYSKLSKPKLFDLLEKNLQYIIIV